MATSFVQADELGTEEVNVIYELDSLPVSKLKAMLQENGMSAHGTKSELVMKLALRQLKIDELASSQFDLSTMTVPQLRELKTSLGVKGTAPTKSSLVELIQDCLS